MNKYKINSLLIHAKEKKKTVHANYVVVLSMQNTPVFWMESSSWFPANFAQEIRWKQGRKMLIFSLVWRIWGAFLQNYWRMNITHTKKDVWMELINGIEGMNVVYSPRLHLGL